MRHTDSSGISTTCGSSSSFISWKPPNLLPNQSALALCSSLRTDNLTIFQYLFAFHIFLHNMEANVQAVSDMVTGGRYNRESQRSTEKNE